MVIASRTPEGDPNRCPVCGNALKLEPSIDTRDGPCPHCGHLLWFAHASQHGQQSEEQSLAEMVLTLANARFGTPSSVVEAAIRGISDKVRLYRMLEQLLTALSWEEFLAKAE
jgi:hypothetical protein